MSEERPHHEVEANLYVEKSRGGHYPRHEFIFAKSYLRPFLLYFTHHSYVLQWHFLKKINGIRKHVQNFGNPCTLDISQSGFLKRIAFSPTIQIIDFVKHIPKINTWKCLKYSDLIHIKWVHYWFWVLSFQWIIYFSRGMIPIPSPIHC